MQTVLALRKGSGRKMSTSLGNYSLAVSHEVFAFSETSQLLTQTLEDSRSMHEMFEGLMGEGRNG